MRITEFRTIPPRGFQGQEVQECRVVEVPDADIPKGTKATSEPVSDWHPAPEKEGEG